MARSKYGFEKDCKELLKVLTGFKEDEENFDRCLQYALSNFKYHRFLDVNSHKMKRDIEGVRVKFLIHSHEAAANTFQALTEKFLATPDFGDSDSGHTDAHYAVLSLLLLLSNSPTREGVSETEVELSTDEEKDDSFDWVSYLLEGDYISHRGVYTNSLDWSADEDSDVQDVEEEDKEFGKNVTEDTFATASLAMVSIETTPVSDHDSGVVNTPESQLEEKMAEVAGRIAPRYWTGQTRSRLTDVSGSRLNDASNLTRLWEKHLIDSIAVYVTRDKAQLTEHQILREILWMLMGVRESFIYSWQKDHFVVNKDIQLSHLTDQTLFNILDDLGHYGSIVWKLNQFVDGVVMETSSSSSSQHCLDNNNCGDLSGSCQTYQAFAIAISHVLQQFKRELITMETDIRAQVETATLSRTLSKLSPHCVRLDFLDVVFRNGIEACCQATSSNAHKASFLLSQIYTTLQRCDAVGGADTEQVSFLFPIWMVSCKPYLDIIDQWVTTGQLNDPCQEFIIHRNSDVKLGDENFWEAALEVHDKSNWTLPASRDQQGDDGDGECVSGMPSFLVPIMYHVVGAGKAAEMLQNLDGLLERDGSDTAGTLYEVFIESLQAYLGTQPSVPREGTTPAEGTTDASLVGKVDPVFADNVLRQLQVKGVKDPLLAENFSQLMTYSATLRQSEECEVDSRPSGLDWSRLTPMKLLLQKCLYPYISYVYKTMSDRLLQMLKEKCGLMDYFAAVRSLYLMEAGDTMYDFYTPLFEKLRFHESWQDASFLNLCLREALQANFSSQADRLFVAVREATRNPSQHFSKEPISALQGLTLQFEVPWPMNIILNSRCMQMYNEVFTFLLQIKRVKYSLDRLAFVDLDRANVLSERHTGDRDVLKAMMSSPLTAREDESDISLVHRVQLLRMRLMHFVNSIHNYMMTRILHSTGIEFQQEMTEARDVDLVIEIHARYMCRVHERCLLHPKVKFLKDIISQVLNMALTFSDHWNDSINSFSVTFLQEMELMLSRCIQFLTSFLNNTIKRGSLPHLESLAFALVTCSELIHR